MAVSTDPTAMGLNETARAIRSCQLSPVELLETTLQRIEGLDPGINSFIEVFAERALAEAAAAEREIADGRHRSPLHGVPIALKDNIAVRGEVCSAGSNILADRVAEEDSAVAARLRDAGAVLLGRLNMHEFAFGVSSENPHCGDVRNPWDTTRMSGGSSGGSGAAVAARLCLAAIGTDTGGSIRLPAAFNGCTGLRPTIGRVSTRGTVPLAPSLDTVGPLARSVEDTALVLDALAGYDPGDPASLDVPVPEYSDLDLEDELHLGALSWSGADRLQPAVHEAFEAALASLEAGGAQVERVELGDLGPVTESLRAINLSEPTVYHHDWLRERPQDYGDDLRARFELGRDVTATRYLQAQDHRAWLTERLRPALERFEALLTPSAPTIAPPLGASTVIAGDSEEPLIDAALRFNALPAMARLPALSVPCGFSDGMPIGLQIFSGPFAERSVLRVGHRYQQLTDWHRREPQANRNRLEA